MAESKSLITALKEYFGMSTPELSKEYRLLSTEDKSQLASELGKVLGCEITVGGSSN